MEKLRKEKETAIEITIKRQFVIFNDGLFIIWCCDICNSCKDRESDIGRGGKGRE